MNILKTIREKAYAKKTINYFYSQAINGAEQGSDLKVKAMFDGIEKIGGKYGFNVSEYLAEKKNLLYEAHTKAAELCSGLVGKQYTGIIKKEDDPKKTKMSTTPRSVGLAKVDLKGRYTIDGEGVLYHNGHAIFTLNKDDPKKAPGEIGFHCIEKAYEIAKQGYDKFFAEKAAEHARTALKLDPESSKTKRLEEIVSQSKSRVEQEAAKKDKIKALFNYDRKDLPGSLNKMILEIENLDLRSAEEILDYTIG